MREKSCVIPLVVALFFPLTPARILVEVKASRTFLLLSTKAGTKFWIPDLRVVVLVTLLLLVNVVAHASTFRWYVGLLLVTMLLLNSAVALTFRVLL